MKKLTAEQILHYGFIAFFIIYFVGCGIALSNV